MKKKIKQQIIQAGLNVSDDGVITHPCLDWVRKSMTYLHIRSNPKMQCGLWHYVLFDLVFGQQYVPSPCFNCYKVVVAPQNVKQLFALHDLQKELRFVSKCGLDGDRCNTEKLYAGYFYNLSLKEGQEKYQVVKKAVNESIGDIPIILKRACTEYENACGPSDKWQIFPEQEEIEAVFNENFTWDVQDTGHDPRQIPGIKQSWIEAAYRWGDKTYREFTSGRPLFDPLVTYHKE